MQLEGLVKDFTMLKKDRAQGSVKENEAVRDFEELMKRQAMTEQRVNEMQLSVKESELDLEARLRVSKETIDENLEVLLSERQEMKAHLEAALEENGITTKNLELKLQVVGDHLLEKVVALELQLRDWPSSCNGRGKPTQ